MTGEMCDRGECVTRRMGEYRSKREEYDRQFCLTHASDFVTKCYGEFWDSFHEKS